jgi:predicted permease
MRTFLEDLRFAARSLRKTPGFTAVAIITLALGLGATTAIFTIVSNVLLRPLPFPDGDRMVRVWETFPSGRGSVSRPNFEDWKAGVRSLELLSTVAHGSYNVVADGEAERMVGVRVSEDFLPLFGVRPILGRTFSREAFQGSNGTEVILDHGVWQRRFAGADVLGRTVSLSGKPYTVVGVMPPDFEFPWFQRVQLWLPHDRAPDPNQGRGNRWLQVFGRLAPGATLDGARAELETLVKQIAVAHPESMKNRGVYLRPLHEFLTASIRDSMWLYVAAVIAVLLIACANVANMLLARAAARHGEIAVRVALGASRWRLVRLLLTEGVALALLGGGLGLLLAVWGIDVCAAVLRVPAVFAVGIDGGAFLFAAALALGSTLIFALVPALRASRVDLGSTLKETGGKVAGGRGLLRSGLVVAQVALSFALLVVSGLLLRSFDRVTSVDPGFDPEHVTTLQIALSAGKYPEDAQQALFFERLIQEVQAVPGVGRAAVVNFLPLAWNNHNGNFSIVGREIPAGIDPVTEFMVASPEYFDAMRIPIVAGRGLRASDREGAPPVAVINQAMARRFFPGVSPVGQRIQLGFGGEREIVGVVADVKRRSLDADAVPETFMPMAQQPVGSMSLVARWKHEPAPRDVAALRGAVARIDPEQAVYEVQSLEQVVRATLSGRRVTMTLVTVFSTVALLLAAIGIYGVVSVQVSQRTRELGIRMALGARAAQVRGMVLGHGLGLVGLGLAGGAVVAFIVARLLAGMFFGVGSADPVAFGAMALVLGVVTLIACDLPARRATRIDPMVALRAE